MPKKKIGIDIRMYNSSGIGRYIRSILDILIREKQDWEFYLLGYKEDLDQSFLCNYPNVRLIYCTSKIYTIREQFELVAKVPKNLDVFWSPHWNIPIFYSGKQAVTIHDMFHLSHPEYVGAFYKLWYAKLMFWIISKKVDIIFTVSKFSKSEILRLTSIVSDKVKVVYNGIDEQWFKVKKGATIYNRPYILYVGNVKPHKNLVRLVKAFDIIKDNYQGDLVIVGKKDGFITADKDIDESVKNLGDRVFFTGFVSDEELEQYYCQADMFVFPSLYEGFGFPPLEALAAGCSRVLCSDIPCLKEVCGDAVEYFDAKCVSKIVVAIKKCSFDGTLQISRLYDWKTATNRICQFIDGGN